MEPRPTRPHRDPLLRSLGLHGEWFFFNSKAHRVPRCLSLHEQPGPTPHRDPSCLRVGSDVLVFPIPTPTRPACLPVTRRGVTW